MSFTEWMKRIEKSRRNVMSKSVDKKCLAPLGNGVDGRPPGLKRPGYIGGKDESGVRSTWIRTLVAEEHPGELVDFGGHLHSWLAEFLSFLRPPALTSLGETEGKCSPLKHWNETPWLSLVTNHHILLCRSWVFDNVWHMTGKEKKCICNYNKDENYGNHQEPLNSKHQWM